MDTSNIVLFDTWKKQYKPVADAIIKNSKREGFDVGSLDEKIGKKYDNAIVYVNRKSLINKTIKQCVRADRIGWWMGDYVEDPDSYLDDSITHIFISSRNLIPVYERTFKRPTYYMPLCGVEGKSEKIRDVTWDILFIGRLEGTIPHRQRKKYFAELGGFNFKLINGEGDTKDKKYLYKNTPINISISRYADGSTSNRLFDILASGGFALVRYFPGLEELFENRKDLVWFTNEKEMVRLVKYYLQHGKERKKIAEAGHQTYLKKHTARHRIKNILDIMEGKTKEFYGYKD